MSETATHPIRFGVQTWPQYTAWSDLRAAWRLIEDLGYDSAWTFDHFYPIMADPKGDCLEGWITLSALAAKTSRIRIGALVTGNTYRNPAVLANMAATLDHISEGRLNFGIGAGWFQLEHDAYGIPYPPVGERIARLDEACTIIRSLWAEEETNFAGRYYAMKSARCEPNPIQKPYPPIMIGGGGEKRTLRVVAKHADIWNWFGGPETFRRKLAILLEHCAAVGRDPREIEISWAGNIGVVTPTRSRASILDELCRRRSQPIEAVEPEVLVGTPEELESRIREFISLGVTHFINSAIPPYDIESVKLFAEKVIPRIQ